MNGQRAAALLLLAAGVCSLSSAQNPSPDTERLFAVGRLWVSALYFHPYLAHKNIDWDHALAETLPAIRGAHGADEYAAAVNKLLAKLNDPKTSARKGEDGTIASDRALSPQRFRFHHGLPPPEGSIFPFYSGVLIRPAPPNMHVSIELGEGVTAQMRIGEPVEDDGGHDSSTSIGPAGSTHGNDAALPEEGMRFVAALRLWGAVRYFFAYKDLMDEDWDRIFERYLPKFLDARDAREYQLTTAELLSHLLDSNATIDGSEINRYFGESSPPVKIRLVERKPVIVALSSGAAKSGLKIGDQITAVDGEGTSDRIKREANYLSAATPSSMGAIVTERLLNGSAGSQAHLNVLTRGGIPKEVTLTRTSGANAENPGDPVRLIRNGAALIDVPRLHPADIPGLLSRLAGAKAIIFDLRGDCFVDPAALASHFAAQRRPAMVVTGPIAENPDLPQPGAETSTASYFSIPTVSPAPDSPQTGPHIGKIALLIDERTRGAAERAALYLVAAAKAQSFGSPSAGSPAEAAHLALPGNIQIHFSGQDIRLLNGAPIERVGLQPTENVPTTIAGIRAGRDEALEKALATLLVVQ